jgi:hypothetical protein
MECFETLEGMSPLLPIFKAIALQGFVSWQFRVNRLKEQLMLDMITLSI